MTKLATRMAQYGRLQEFQPENEKISAYLERVDLFFDAYDVADPKKVSILLNNIGVKTYGLLRSLTAPRAPKEKTLAELTTLLQSHYEPTPIVIAERYRFHRRDQTAEESVADYVAELRRQATHCKFEDTTEFLEESLRDRFVCGLRAESTRKRLLTEDKLTFKKAVELAQSLETATKDAQQLKEPEKFGTVHRVVSPPGRKECYRCGRTNHSAGECKFKETMQHVSTVANEGTSRKCAEAPRNHLMEDQRRPDNRKDEISEPEPSMSIGRRAKERGMTTSKFTPLESRRHSRFK